MTEHQYVIAKNSILVSSALSILKQIQIGRADEYGVSKEQFTPILNKLSDIEDWLLRCSFVEEEEK